VKSRLRILVSLLILVSLFGSSSSLAYSKEQAPLPMLTTFTLPAPHGLSALSQVAHGSPCLTPSVADTSSAQVRPGSSNSSIPGSVVPVVQVGKASRTGIVPASQQVRLELVFSLRNPSQFNQCLDSIMEPKSPNYGDFLNTTTLLPTYQHLDRKHQSQASGTF
jgi:hypothetical protein